MKNQILVIGTIPPCPRCKLLTEILTIEAKALGIESEIRHIAYTSEEASLIAKEIGTEPGTAKEVAERMGCTIKWDNQNDVEVPPLLWDDEQYKNLAHLRNVFEQVNILDNRLGIYEEAAENNGILMTPVFILNGKIIHNGSVPKIEFIRSILREL